jgi:hypothetical protein
VTIPARLALSPEDRIMGSARCRCAVCATSKVYGTWFEHVGSIPPSLCFPAAAMAAEGKGKSKSTKPVACNRYARHTQHRL